MTRKVPLGNDSDQPGSASEVRSGVENLVKEHCDGYSGADLAALVREAGVVALRRTLGALDSMEPETQVAAEQPSIHVGLEDFVRAMDKVQPSVSFTQRRRYEALRSKFAGLPVKGGKDDEVLHTHTQQPNVS